MAKGTPSRNAKPAPSNPSIYVRPMPADFPPWRTVYAYFIRWSDNLTTIGLTDQLRASMRTALGRPPQPTAGCIDSQSVRESAEGVVPATTRGYDAFKRDNGRKRHFTVDTLDCSAMSSQPQPTSRTSMSLQLCSTTPRAEASNTSGPTRDTRRPADRRGREHARHHRRDRAPPHSCESLAKPATTDGRGNYGSLATRAVTTGEVSPTAVAIA